MSDIHTEDRARLAAAVLEVIAAGPEGDPAVFDSLALEIFEYQYAGNAAYRAFCDAKKVVPDTVDDWRDVPALPSQAFKDELVTSFPLEEAVLAICTGGTTSSQRGKILRDELGRELACAANRAMTRAYLFPDLDRGARCRLLILAPSPQMAPSMGMTYGMEQMRLAFGTPDSRYLVGWSGMDIPGLIQGLEEAEASGEPVALVGATSAYVYFFNAAKKKGLSWRLPPGSRVCDGGGYRGRFGEVTRDDYYGMCEDVLGVASDHCVNTLGMGENATNYFDNVLRESTLGRPGARRRKDIPPWTRVDVVSIEDLSILPPGEVGLLRHVDLANLPMALAVQTDNLGVCYEDGGFEILGRAQLIDGKVVPMPSERPVGPMGDQRLFSLMEAYVRFSIDFKMGRVTGRVPVSPETTVAELPDEVALTCPAVVDELVAAADDPRAKARAEAALGRRSPSAKSPGEEGESAVGDG